MDSNMFEEDNSLADDATYDAGKYDPSENAEFTEEEMAEAEAEENQEESPENKKEATSNNNNENIQNKIDRAIAYDEYGKKGKLKNFMFRVGVLFKETLIKIGVFLGEMARGFLFGDSKGFNPAEQAEKEIEADKIKNKMKDSPTKAQKDKEEETQKRKEQEVKDKEESQKAHEKDVAYVKKIIDKTFERQYADGTKFNIGDQIGVKIDIQQDSRKDYVLNLKGKKMIVQEGGLVQANGQTVGMTKSALEENDDRTHLFGDGVKRFQANLAMAMMKIDDIEKNNKEYKQVVSIQEEEKQNIASKKMSCVDYRVQNYTQSMVKAALVYSACEMCNKYKYNPYSKEGIGDKTEITSFNFGDKKIIVNAEKEQPKNKYSKTKIYFEIDGKEIGSVDSSKLMGYDRKSDKHNIDKTTDIKESVDIRNAVKEITEGVYKNVQPIDFFKQNEIVEKIFDNFTVKKEVEEEYTKENETNDNSEKKEETHNKAQESSSSEEHSSEEQDKNGNGEERKAESKEDKTEHKTEEQEPIISDEEFEDLKREQEFEESQKETQGNKQNETAEQEHDECEINLEQFADYANKEADVSDEIHKDEYEEQIDESNIDEEDLDL
jgi:hypothetical protein